MLQAESLISRYNDLNGKPSTVAKLKKLYFDIQRHVDSTGHGAYMSELKGIYERLASGIKMANGYDLIEKISVKTISLKKELNGIDRIEVGEISEQIAKKIKRQKGKIFLETGNDVFGISHIERNHKKKIEAVGLTIEDFVRLVCSGFNEIREGNRGALLLIRLKNGNHAAVVKLVTGDFYSVYSAFPTGINYLKKRKLLWSQAEITNDTNSSLGSAIISGGKQGGSHRTSVSSHKSLDAKLAILDKWLMQTHPTPRNPAKTVKLKSLAKKKITPDKNLGVPQQILNEIAAGPIIPKKSTPIVITTGLGGVSGDHIAGLNFKKFDLTGEYKNIFGKLYGDTQMMFWGMPGHGKTVGAMKLAQYLSDQLNLRTLYVASEEYGRSTFTEKFEVMKKAGTPIGHPNLKFVKSLVEANVNDFDAIIFDSAQGLGWDLKTYKKFVLEHPGKIYISIIQSTKDGDFRGGQDWEHEMDIAGEFINWKLVLRKNRLDPELMKKRKAHDIEQQVKEQTEKKMIKEKVNAVPTTA